MDTMKQEEMVRILEKQMVPALGCTDPVGVAFAAASARKLIGGDLLAIDGEISVNIVKNAAAVCIPKTGGRCGLALAIALGAICGDPEKGLLVLDGISEKDIRAADAFLTQNGVSISVSESRKKLFMRMHLLTTEGEAAVTIEDRYTDIRRMEVNGETVFCAKPNEPEEERIGESEEEKEPPLSLEIILDFANVVSPERIGIIREAVKRNMAIAEEGLAGDYGLAVGKSLRNFVKTGTLGQDFVSEAMVWTAAATDARMAGVDMTVISNTGSGNQGLASTVPVISIAKMMEADEETMLRAVTVSSLVTIYIKEKLGALSAVCGAVIAGAGTGCGVAYLLGGGKAQMEMVLQNTLGDIAGMLCDGAKAGCAMKVATCINTGVMAALFAASGKGIQGSDGIVGGDEAQTIENFVRIAKDGMHRMDHVILDIILQKEGK